MPWWWWWWVSSVKRTCARITHVVVGIYFLFRCLIEEKKNLENPIGAVVDTHTHFFVRAIQIENATLTCFTRVARERHHHHQPPLPLFLYQKKKYVFDQALNKMYTRKVHNNVFGFFLCRYGGIVQWIILRETKNTRYKRQPIVVAVANVRNIYIVVCGVASHESNIRRGKKMIHSRLYRLY